MHRGRRFGLHLQARQYRTALVAVAGRAREVTGGGMSGLSQANILVVDDDRHGLAAMRELLSGPDRNVLAVGSGKEALRQILKIDFALILLDVRMPEMDGFETATLIRKLKRSRHTPIMFLTAAGDGLDLMRGYEVGA